MDTMEVRESQDTLDVLDHQVKTEIKEAKVYPIILSLLLLPQIYCIKHPYWDMTSTIATISYISFTDLTITQFFTLI